MEEDSIEFEVSSKWDIESLLTVSVFAVCRFHLDRMAHLQENRENDSIIYARIRNVFARNTNRNV